MIEPLVFHPLYMERPWGGRSLARLYGRALPEGPPIGESWEIVDREREQSVVAEGPWAGRTLHDLWTGHRAEIFGENTLGHPSPRFPLLIKILDAADTLSIQVHPPAHCAAELGGEPKTEMWYIAAAEPGAALYAGVKEGVDRARFEQALADGSVASAVPTLPVAAGDSIFIPSGRLHAIGAGLVIFEIQQNSDTTYRVFDWNRLGLDGKPRTLHVEESLRCIDFTDTAPALNPPDAAALADCPYFRVEKRVLQKGQALPLPGFRIFAVASGRVTVGSRTFAPGDFFFMPAAARGQAEITALSPATLLEISLP